MNVSVRQAGVAPPALSVRFSLSLLHENTVTESAM